MPGSGFSAGFAPSGFGSGPFARTASGLLFRDDFERPDSLLVGAAYTVQSGTWVIEGGRLKRPSSATQGILRLAAVGTIKNSHVQVLVTKQPNLSDFGVVLTRYQVAPEQAYVFDIAGSGDGTDPNKARILRDTGGAVTRLAGGYAPPGYAAGIAMRYNITTQPGEQKFWIDGTLALATADASAANDIVGYIALDAIPQGLHCDILWDTLIVCTSRVISVTGLPAGYTARAAGVTSAASDGVNPVTIDIAGALLPITLLEVLDTSNVVVGSRVEDIYGGDTWNYSATAAYGRIGSGGVVIGGSAPFTATRSYRATGAGGVSVAGTAPNQRGWLRSAAGGVIVAGSGTPAFGRGFVGSGGVVIGGSASASQHRAATRTVILRRSYTGTGEVGERAIDLPAIGVLVNRRGAAGAIVARATGEEGMPKKPKPPHHVIVSTWLRQGAGGVAVGGSAPATYYKGLGVPGITPTHYAGFGHGGVRVGGSAPSSSSNSRQYARAGSGGVIVSGQAPFVITAPKGWARTGSGGVLVRGAAPSGYVIVPPPGGGSGGVWNGVVDPPATFDPSRNPAHFTSEVTATSFANLQALINTSPPGTRIRVPLGVNWLGGLRLRNRGFGANSTEWIEIAPDLPHAAIEAARPYGREMTLGIAGSLNLPTLRSPGGNVSVVDCDAGATGYRFTGINFALGGVANAMVRLGKTDMNSAAEACRRLIVDRCTAVGGATYYCNRAFFCIAEQCAVIGCWIADIYGNQDSQGVLMAGWQGPYVVMWNHIEGWSENVMMGGFEAGAGGVASDVVVEYNRIVKNIAYRNGAPQGNTEKNLVEAKSVRRARIRFNHIQYQWYDGQDVSINLKSVNQTKTQPQQGTSNLEFAWNRITQIAGGIKMIADPEGGATDMFRVSVHDNLFEGVNTVPGYNNSGLMVGIYGGLDQIAFDHNTFVKATAGPLNGGAMAFALDQSAIGPIAVRSNLLCMDGYGLKSSAGVGDAAWKAYVPNPANRMWYKNGLVNRPSAAGYPAGDIAFANDAAVGYADLANGDYTVTGPAATAGHDGGPLGISNFAAFLANLATLPG